MTLEVYTPDAITDEIVQIFETVDYGELYYKRVLSGCFYNNDIMIERQHLEPVKDIIKPITKDQLKLIVSKALYKFLNKNTAYGFADWARNNDKLRWRLG